MYNRLYYVNLIQRKPRCIPPKLGIARTFFYICPKTTAEAEMPLPPQAAAAPPPPPDCRVLLLSVSGPPSSTRPPQCFHSGGLLSGLLIQIIINLLLVYFLSFPPGAAPLTGFCFVILCFTSAHALRSNDRFCPPPRSRRCRPPRPIIIW